MARGHPGAVHMSSGHGHGLLVMYYVLLKLNYLIGRAASNVILRNSEPRTMYNVCHCVGFEPLCMQGRLHILFELNLVTKGERLSCQGDSMEHLRRGRSRECVCHCYVYIDNVDVYM